MNDYDNRQLIGRGQRLPYVNDHDKRANENKVDIAYSMLNKRVYDAGKETFTKEHLKNNSKISVGAPSKKLPDKMDPAYEQCGFISVSASVSPPVADRVPSIIRTSALLDITNIVIHTCNNTVIELKDKIVSGNLL
jgi:hypothetical protein